MEVRNQSLDYLGIQQIFFHLSYDFTRDEVFLSFHSQLFQILWEKYPISVENAIRELDPKVTPKSASESFIPDSREENNFFYNTNLWLCDYNIENFIQQYPKPQELKNLSENQIHILYDEFLSFQKLFLFNKAIIHLFQQYHLAVKVCILMLQRSYNGPQNRSCFNFTNRKQFYGVLCNLDKRLFELKFDNNFLFTRYLDKISTKQVQESEPPIELIQKFNKKPVLDDVIYLFIQNNIIEELD